MGRTLLATFRTEKTMRIQVGGRLKTIRIKAVVTYYENLQNAALVIEGFVDQDELHVPFKAIIDLHDTSLSAISTSSRPRTLASKRRGCFCTPSSRRPEQES